MAIRIEPLALRAADESTYRPLNALLNQLRAERAPDDPPVSLSDTISYWHSLPGFITVHAWGVREESEEALIAWAAAFFGETGSNLHLGQFTLEVAPRYRRRRIGSRLLSLVAGAAHDSERRLLVTQSNSRVKAGAAFLERFGARPGLAAHTNQLELAELDPALLEAWLGRAPEGFELGLWDGPYPEADMAGIIALMEVMNQQPYDDLEVEDFEWTPEMVRQIEGQQLAGERKRWTLYARERETGDFAGFTEVMLNPARPTIVQQGNTGVLPQFRNRGLGRWLKAAMLKRVLAEWPEGRYVRTGNADSNAPMLRINRELGFQPYLSETLWQMETALVRERLAALPEKEGQGV
jgi:GNAT superfamily N-acetyltransferase